MKHLEHLQMQLRAAQTLELRKELRRLIAIYLEHDIGGERNAIDRANSEADK